MVERTGERGRATKKLISKLLSARLWHLLKGHKPWTQMSRNQEARQSSPRTSWVDKVEVASEHWR